MKAFIPYHKPFVGREEAAAASKAVLSGALSGNGPQGRRLEEAFQRLTGARRAFFTTSATSAIEMALLALDIKKGDEVICPSFSFVSLANAVVKTGAKLVFAEIDEDTFNLDPHRLEEKISRRTRLILPVHYAGHACDMAAILKIARRAGARVLEDAAQAIGGRYRSRHLGTLGDVGALSLHGTKNVTCGEGGIFLTNDDALAEAADIIREKGTNRTQFLRRKAAMYQWMSIGSSYVQSDVLAAVALEQLKKLPAVNARREANALYLNARLAKWFPLARPQKRVPGAAPNWHIYALRLPDRASRDRFIAAMRERGVECTTHFVPLHLSAFAKKNLGTRPGDFPATERVCDTLVRLPVYPQLGKAEMKRVADAADAALAQL